MRIAELVGCTAYDADGAPVGAVHDVRFVADGPPYEGTGKPAYRLHALIVGDAAIGLRLGYGRGHMAGPWLLQRIFRGIAARSRLVEWADVVRFERPRIEIRRRAADLESMASADEGSGPR